MLTLGQQIRDLEVLGYVTLPDTLTRSELETLRSGVETLALEKAERSDKESYLHDVYKTAPPSLLELIAFAPLIRFIEAVFGDDLICAGVSYVRLDPGYEGMPIHTDSQPYGSAKYGPVGTSPRLLRALIYLDDLTPQRAPLIVVPSSHLSLHSDANPYLRYRTHPDAIEVTCKAGSIVVINQRLFHGVGPNTTPDVRRVFTVSYRPAWAPPIAPLPEVDPATLERLPRRLLPLFRSPNTSTYAFSRRITFDEMPSDAPGLGESRWRR